MKRENEHVHLRHTVDTHYISIIDLLCIIQSFQNLVQFYLFIYMTLWKTHDDLEAFFKISDATLCFVENDSFKCLSKDTHEMTFCEICTHLPHTWIEDGIGWMSVVMSHIKFSENLQKSWKIASSPKY